MLKFERMGWITHELLKYGRTRRKKYHITKLGHEAMREVEEFYLHLFEMIREEDGERDEAVVASGGGTE